MTVERTASGKRDEEKNCKNGGKSFAYWKLLM
jgi:hypothetical protein